MVCITPRSRYTYTNLINEQSAMYFADGTEAQQTVLKQSGEPYLPLTKWAFQYSSGASLTVSENWALNYARDHYRDEYHGLMKSRGVDFILAPTYLGVAAVLGEAQYWNYTAIWNILDQPAVVFPSGLVVDEELDKPEEGYQPLNAADEREWKKYSPGRYVGAPIGLQLVGKRFKDEEVLAAAKVVEAALRAEDSKEMN